MNPYPTKEEVERRNAWLAGAKDVPADVVNHPPHYQADGIECIDVIEAVTRDMKGMHAVCTANVLKYLWRWPKKGGVESLKKARWYLDRLIADLEK
jgi:hypothetical protein